MKFFSHSTATVAINLEPRQGSWGGANQWTSQLSRWLHYHGWKVRYDLKKIPDVIIMTHTGLSAGTSFGAAEVAALKKDHPYVRCLHRINDNDLRKESSEMDLFLSESNHIADHTVFVSKWLRDHHGAKWFDLSKPHSVITPGADLRYFHPIGGSLPALEPFKKSYSRCSARNEERSSAVYSDTRGREYRSDAAMSGYNSFEKPLGEPLRLVTHHWSDNWSKGFDVYQQIDEFIASQQTLQFELWVIGRWPKEIQWKSARTFAPATGIKLATLLRQCHGYVSASRFEPGAMHIAEGLQCGLPLLYHRDSGGTVEQGLRYGLEIGDDLGKTLNSFAEQLPQLRAKLLADPPSGSKMSLEYLQLLQRLIVF